MIEKNASRRPPRKMTDRGLKKKHHRMTPIEHFLTDIMQASFTDWIENSIADIGREIAPTDIFQPTLRNFFLKTLAGQQCFFLRQRKFSCFGVAWKIFQVGRLGFFLGAQPTFCFGRNWHVPIYSARKTLAHLGKKIFANRLHTYFIQIWIENSIADNGREIGPTDIFQPTLHNFYLKTLADR